MIYGAQFYTPTPKIQDPTSPFLLLLGLLSAILQQDENHAYTQPIIIMYIFLPNFR